MIPLLINQSNIFRYFSLRMSKRLAGSDLAVIGLTGIGPIGKISVLDCFFAVLAQWKFLYCIDRFDHIKANKLKLINNEYLIVWYANSYHFSLLLVFLGSMRLAICSKIWFNKCMEIYNTANDVSIVPVCSVFPQWYKLSVISNVLLCSYFWSYFIIYEYWVITGFSTLTARRMPLVTHELLLGLPQPEFIPCL